MEKSETDFIVSPACICLNPSQESFQFSIKNVGYRSCHYEVFLPDCNHFKLIGNRSFSLAPGISKTVKVKHLSSPYCSAFKERIEVIDGFGNRQETYVSCQQEVIDKKKSIDIVEELTVSELRVNEERRVEIKVKNSSVSNLKIRANQVGNSEKVQLKMEENSFILLKNTTKTLKVSIKMLVEAEVQITLQVESIEEESKEVEISFIGVTCNSLLRSQFIVGEDMNKADSAEHEILNGTSVKGSFYLVNNYHQACPFKILEVIEVHDYKQYSQRLSELCFKPAIKEGILEPRAKMEIVYGIMASLTQNDRSFTQRYSQLSFKDESNAYKLRNSKHFRKQIEVVLKIRFGEDHLVYYRIKSYVINPAVRISRNPSQLSDNYAILNDSGIEVPYKIANNLYLFTKPEQGTLHIGLNSLDISWKSQQSPFTSKENGNKINRCQVKMEIPQNQICLFEPATLSRPKTALLKDQSRVTLTKDVLKERISARAPAKKGEAGVRGYKEVGAKDILLKENKYVKHQTLDEQQFCYIQINQNQKGYVLTNAHPSKDIMIFINGKGHLFMESCYSYALPFEKQSLLLEHNGKALEVKPREIDDHQPYKLKNKELLFCFSQGQKEFEVVKEIEVVNRSNDLMMMYCLSVEDEYFHSLQPNHKVLIQPNSSQTYRISFRPQSEQFMKSGKVTRSLEFMINQQKEVVSCQGDLLLSLVTTDVNNLIFKNCAYSSGEVSKTFTLLNKGISKVTYNIQHSSNIKVAPNFGVINEKGKQNVVISFRPSEMTKEYSQNIVIQLKGSHLIVLPFQVNTLEPDIYCQESIIDFQEGYLAQNITSKLTIVNKNPYPCNLTVHLEGTQMAGEKKVLVQAETTNAVELQLLVKELGEKVFKLPSNFIELKGYGAIKGPKQYRYTGKKTFLQVIPDYPFKGLVCSKHQQTSTFVIKNISQKMAALKVILSQKSPQEYLILSCEPSSTELKPGEERQFRLHSIRADEEEHWQASKKFDFSLSIFIDGDQLYRRMDFSIAMPPPGLEINPREVFFPLACVGTWCKSSFTVWNQGHKEVFIAVKKPTNIPFDLEVQFQNNDNRLTKLKNKLEVNLFYKSKKPISFGAVLEVENNFGQKYEVKLNGTVSSSPLLKCDRVISPATGLSSRQIKTLSSTSSLKSLTLIDSPSEQHQNFKFFSKWINGIFPDSSRKGQNFNQWLATPANFQCVLDYINSGVVALTQQERTLPNIMDQLKRLGYPVYSVQEKLLKEGSSSEWAQCLWFILSKDTVKEECLKWINKLCGIKLDTYDNAYNHHHKILIDVISKIFQPIFKTRITDWQKISDIFEPSIPILPKIDNKRQFVLLINLLFNKLSSIQTHEVSTTNCVYRLQLPKHQPNSPHPYWILGSDSFDVDLPENCSHQRYLPDKKLLSFMAEGPATVNIKFREDTCLAVWSNGFEQRIKFYQVTLDKKAPISHNITIECEDQCTQDWKLKFPCEIESEYSYSFEGCSQFKCKMPPLGIIKAGDVLDFAVIYSPTNLKEHRATLTIATKFEQHIYNVRGKPLRTTSIQTEKTLSVFQGQRCTETFSIPESPLTTSACYVGYQFGTKTEELKNVEVKSNKKQIMVTTTFECQRLLRNYQMILQVSDKEQSFSRNIRLILNVVARAVIIQAELKGIVDQKTIEKIPVTNLISSKQICHVSFHSLTKEQYESFSQQALNRQEEHPPEPDQFQFILNHQGKLSLKPHESTKLQLSYMPSSAIESFCQVRLRFQQSEQLIVYNFRGVAEVPSTDNQPLEISCEVEKEVKRSIKVYNKLREKMRFEVETNLSFIAGAQEIVMQPKQHLLYQFKMRPLHAGSYSGKLVFKNEKVCLVYPLSVTVTDEKKIPTITVKSKIRVASTISIQLSNKSGKDVEYQVLCEKDYLEYPQTISIPAQSEKALILRYTPLFSGIKTVLLKLYNEFSNQITYQLEMISEPHFEDVFASCQLGEPKLVKVNIKNQTKIAALLQESQLPQGLTLKPGSSFPIPLLANSTMALELVFTPQSLQSEWEDVLILSTDKIGSYTFNVGLFTDIQKVMAETIVQYDYEPQKKQLQKYLFIEMVNPFNEALPLKFQKMNVNYHKKTSIRVESQENIMLQPYQKRMIRARVDILPFNPEEVKISQKNIEDRAIILKSGDFRWVFPIILTQVRSSLSVIEIRGPSHQFLSSRVNLKHIKSLKKWQVSDFPDYQKQLNMNLLSSNDLNLQAIINKNMEYMGFITFYQDDMALAEKYPLSLKIGGSKIKSISIEANVGETGVSKIKIKNGRGSFRVDLKNNRKKEFRVSPLQGIFSQTQENIFTFEYQPIQYNGSKKAEVAIESEGGNFDFCLVGKFPNSKA